MLDPKTVERIGPDYWRHGFLSVAKYSGGCIIQGTRYTLDPDTDYLVRDDIYRAELKDAAKKARVDAAEKKKWNAIAQAGLFQDKEL